MTGRVRMLLKARDSAFRSGDRALYSAARGDLRRGITKAKTDYKKRIEDHLTSNNPRQVWQGIKNITNYRGCDTTTGDWDVIAIPLHSALSHLEHRGSYVRLLFIDYSSAFNTIIPDILVCKLSNLGLPPPTCSWIKDFLTNRPQRVRLGPHHSSTRTLSTGSPQGITSMPYTKTFESHLSLIMLMLV